MQTGGQIPRSTDMFLFLFPFFLSLFSYLPLPIWPLFLPSAHFHLHYSLGPLTCPLLSSFTTHLPSPSSVLSSLASPRLCVSLLAWIAAVISASPRVIRGQCRNRCMAGWISDNTTRYRPSTLSFVITDSSVKKEAEGGGRDMATGFVLGRNWETETPYTYKAIYSTHSSRVQLDGQFSAHIVTFRGSWVG